MTSLNKVAQLRFTVGLELDRLPRRSFAQGAILRRPDETPDTVYLIDTGTVRPFFTSPHGLDALFADLSSGDFVGDLTAIDGQSLDIYFEAITETTVFVLRRNQFLEILKNSPDFAWDVARRLCERLRTLNRLYIENRVLPMKARLYAELIRLSSSSDDGEISISPPPTHAELARRIASQRETVTKQISALAKDGILRQSGNKMIIERIDELRHRVSGFLGDLPCVSHRPQRHC